LNRKLWILNLALAALAVFAGLQLRSRWVADKARAAARLHKPASKIPAPPFTPNLAPPAVLPSNYLNVAQKDLFDPSRNPDVPVDPPKPPPPPPPPPPMPSLPSYHGVMNFGDGPLAIMSVTATGKHEAIKPGEMIGPFKLIDVTRDDLTLEWNGQMVRKQLWELQNRSLPVAEAPKMERTEQPPPPKPAVREESKGPGESYNTGSRGCQPGDTDPVGTVKDGYKKVSVPTPFGPACLWDPVSK
jgi:hypothetical protein